MVYTSTLPAKEIPTDLTVYDVLFTNNQFVSQDDVLYVDIENPDRQLTYAQLHTEILKCAAGLKREFGLEYGDVVAVCSPNHLYYPVLVHATVCAGGVFSAIDQVSSAKDIADNLDTIQAKVLIAHIDTLDKVLEAAKIYNIPLSNIIVFDETASTKKSGIRSISQTLLNKPEDIAVPHRYTPQQITHDPCYLYFTSGTTGRKKAVIITQYQSVYVLLPDHSNINSIPKPNKSLAYTEFHHGTSLFVVFHVAIYFGYKYYIMPHYSFEKMCHAIEKYQIQFLMAQPYIVTAFIKEAANVNLSSLKMIVSAGATIDSSMVRAAKKELGVSVLNIFGMTEILSFLDTTLAISEAGGLGSIRPGYTAKIVDKEGNEVQEGEVGELLLKGPTITPGYYRNPEATANALDKDGFFRTGDLMRMGEDGILIYAGRGKELIKFMLYHIYPVEIENVLVTHPKVSDCAVIGVYDASQGSEIPRAYVQLIETEKHQDKEAQEQVRRELMDYTDSQLDDFKRLRGGIVFVDTFPRSAVGKIQKRLLGSCDV